MTADTAVRTAKDIAATKLAPTAVDNDRRGRFSPEAIEALSAAGLLGMMLSSDLGGGALGPRALADVVAALAEADASVAMVFLMHTVAALTIAAAPRTAALEKVLGDIVGGRHLSTLAFSEAGSRSHFWAPVSTATAEGAQVRMEARKSWVTSAGEADLYVWSCKPLAAQGASTLWLIPADTPGLTILGTFDGLGLLQSTLIQPYAVQGE